MKYFLSVILFLSLFCFSLCFASDEKDFDMKLKILIGDVVLLAELNDTSVASDLISKLPVSFEMYKHQNREFYTQIPLNKSDKTQSGYQIGDIGYWVPGNALVFFYDKGFTDDLIVIGRITDGVDKLSEIKSDSISVKVELLK